jgi:hypothetical protein
MDGGTCNMITLEFNLFVLILKSLAQIDGTDLLLVYTDIIVGKTCQYSCRNAKQVCPTGFFLDL